MAATIEIKYYNSFWLKKMSTITVATNTTGVSSGATTTTTLTLSAAPSPVVSVGQSVTWTTSSITYTLYVVKVVSTTSIILSAAPASGTMPTGSNITFGPISDFTNIPVAYAGTIASDWYIEESRIKGGYNNTDVDLGVRAFIVEPEDKQVRRESSLIYSGAFNSKTGINNTNQFPTGEDITTSLNPSDGSIQKLYAEDTNLNIFQELKVSRALIDKQAVYSAEGRPMSTSSDQVIGQVQAYAGRYGISTHPESFAVFGYRKYFVDSNQGLVLRLSQDGITEISSYGMRDYFTNVLENITPDASVIGGWDQHSKQYVVSLQPSNGSFDYATLAFDEEFNGWTSFYNYKPEDMSSIRNFFYSIKTGNIWYHYSNSVTRGSFYDTVYDSSVKLILNGSPSLVKNFQTINYEGDAGWQMSSFITDDNLDNSCYIAAAPVSGTISTLSELQNQVLVNNFKLKENKYFANIFNISTVKPNEVVYGQSISGVRGFYSNVTMSISNATVNRKSELFSVSSNYVESSY